MREFSHSFEDDVSAPGKGAKLVVGRDPQGDLYITVRNRDGSCSDPIRICGAGGGSRYPGLASSLATAFLEAASLSEG